MAARDGLFDGLLAIGAKLPWWLCIVVAAVSYAALHYVAIGDVPMPATTKVIGEVVIRTVIKTAAGVFQYIVPIAFVVGGVLSFAGRNKRNALHERASKEGLKAIAPMSWREFEMLIGEAFRRQGFRVTERGGKGADGGVDLELARHGERHMVQCKHWRATRVSVAVVRELYGAMAAEGAAGGFVVTAGEFTKDAQDFAKGRNIALIAGAALAVMLRDGSNAAGKSPAAAPLSPISASDSQYSARPICPNCGKEMVKRMARRGANAGNEFWGCTGFPGCRGIRSVA